MMLDPAIWIFSSGEHRALEGTKGRQGVEKCLNGDACHISDKVHLLLTPRGKDRQRENLMGCLYRPCQETRNSPLATSSCFIT